MAINAAAIAEIFERLGSALQKPAVLCLIGSTPGIASGQTERQTPDMDVWYAASEFDSGDLARACREVGVLFDPTGEIDSDQIYIQVIRPGIVRLPVDFTPEVIGKFGNLTISMPPPEYLAAAKLVRGSEVDIDDVVWWIRKRGLDAANIERAIEKLPSERDREAAAGNMTFVHLVMGQEWT